MFSGHSFRVKISCFFVSILVLTLSMASPIIASEVDPSPSPDPAEVQVQQSESQNLINDPNSLTTQNVSPRVPSAVEASSIKFFPGNGSLLVSWTAPSDGGSPITDYEVAYSTSSGTPKTWTSFSDAVSATPQVEITGLGNPRPGSTTEGYFVRVRAINTVGNSDWTESTTSSTTVPGQNGNRAIVGDPGCVANELPGNDDGSTGSISLGQTVNWYGTNYTNVAYNNNGGIKFNSTYWGQYSGLNLAATNNDPLIVALFNDLDTRNGQTTAGTWGPLTYPINGYSGYCFNWVNFGDYSTGAPSKSAQLILLFKSNNDIDLMFNYNWLTQGSRTVITGWAAPGGQGYIFQNPIPESNTSAQQGTGPGSLVENKNIPATYSNYDVKGRYIFELTGGTVQGAPGSPSAPQNLTYSGVGNGSVTLDWDEPASNGGSAITNYTIQYSLDGVSGWTNFNRSSSTTTIQRVTGLTNGTAYYFRVTAFSNVSGDASSIVGPITPVAAPENTSAPTFTGTATFGQQLSGSAGSWTDGGSPVTSTTYQWQVSIGCTGTYTAISGENSLTYTVDRKAVNGCVRLAVTTTNANGSNVAYSTASSQILANPPGAPATPLFVDSDSTSVSINWSSPANDGGADITEYIVQYSTDELTWLTFSPNPTGTRLKVTGLTTGTSYFFRVKANNGQDGSWSATAGPFAAIQKVVSTPAGGSLPSPTPTVTPQRTVRPNPAPTNTTAAAEIPLQRLPGFTTNTTDISLPITLESGLAPVAIPGNAVMLVNGVPQFISLVTIENSVLRAVSSDGLSFEVNIKQTGNNSNSVPQVVNGSLIVTPGKTLSLQGEGFAQSSDVTIWLFSEPKRLAQLKVDSFGNLSADVAIELGLPVGKHTLQVNGFHPDGTVRSVALSIVVPEETAAENSAPGKVADQNLDWLMWAFAIPVVFGLFFAVFYLVRRKSISR